VALVVTATTTPSEGAGIVLLLCSLVCSVRGCIATHCGGCTGDLAVFVVSACNAGESQTLVVRPAEALRVVAPAQRWRGRAPPLDTLSSLSGIFRRTAGESDRLIR
jgi:hypothetical protein